MAIRATIAGSATLAPPSGAGGTSTTRSFRLIGTFTYDEKHTFAGAQTDAPVGLGPITNVKWLVGYSNAPLDLKITFAGGVDQVVPLDGHLALFVPNRPITAIKLNGTGDGELLLAGD